MTVPLKPAIDAVLVRALIASQFPSWAHLPITPIEPGGVDNRTFRLGEDMLVRLPAAEVYSLQVAKEQHWLPILAPGLPVLIPTPRALGRPGQGYPWCWSVYGWLSGEVAEQAEHDRVELASEVAGFLAALHRLDPAGGPAPGPHNCHRGAPLAFYEEQVCWAVGELGAGIDADRILRLWARATATSWQRAPVWLHGDISPGNLLLREGRLAAVIDFGCCGIGDPACDLAIAWSEFDADARAAFRGALPLDADTWERGRGWALWKALVTLAGGAPHQIERARTTLARVLD